MQYLEELNAPQRQAVEHVEGPLLIIAGAGSGKTRIVTYRILHLLDIGVPSSAILGVTFTNKAAQEMRERVRNLTQNNVLISTFHSLGVRILRESISALGYTPDFIIYDQDDSKRLIKACMADLNAKDKGATEKTLQSMISLAKNNLTEPQDVDLSELTEPAELVFPEVYSLYQAKLRDYNAVDFDDLLLLVVRLFTEHPDILKRYQDQWKFLLVDEYQDTNTSQYEMIRLLAGEQRNLCVVGDPDQAIYSWRGADIRNIMEFEKDFSGTTIIRLEENYRSTSTILKAANALIQHNYSRYEKDLWSAQGEGEPLVIYEAMNEHEEADFVLDKIDELNEEGVPLSEMVIFYRTNFQSRQFEDVLLRARIPYVIVGGVSFYQRKEVKDILAYMRVVASGADFVSIARTINLPKRGIGETTLSKLKGGSEEARLPLFDFCAKLMDPNESNPPLKLAAKARKGLTDYVAVIKDLRETYKADGLRKLVETAITGSGYLDHLKTDRETFDDRRENLYELVAKAAEWESGAEDKSLNAFLAELTLTTTLDEASKATNDRISLMTSHNGKGLEFDVAFLVGMEEDLFPHVNSRNSDEQLEEERRLCYVGITRARKRVFLTYTRRRFLWGTPRSMRKSRFLKELPNNCVKRVYKSSSWDNGSVDSVEEVCSGDDEFEEGQGVFHRDFGTGIVIRAYEGSMGRTYEIVFERSSTPKTIVAKYADLQRT